LGSKTGVSEHSNFTENSEIFLFQTFQKLQKNDVKSNFGIREKLVPTRKPTRMFGLKFGMQGLTVYISEIKINSTKRRYANIVVLK